MIVETHRPVTLHNHYAIAERGRDRITVLPLLREGAPNPDGLALDDRRRRNPRHRYRTPRRGEVVEYLAAAGLLPAITFIFSRAACDDATRQCLQDGIRLTTGEERARIRELAEAAVERLSDDDLRTLGYGPWSAALEAGIAPHHAGLVPAFRQAVERCFSEGLLKVVFATETLALGINMPARTVVVERFAKFRGSDTSALTSGEYRQLTGRAGRRGIDTVGHAVVAVVGRPPRSHWWPAPPPPRRPTWSPRSTPPTTWPSTWCAGGRGKRPTGSSAASYGQWQAPPGSVSLAALLDRRLAILEQRGFIEGWRMTEPGHALASIYHESDLLVTEALRQGLFDGLDPPSLAGVASALTFEARRAGDDERPPRQRPVVERLASPGPLAGALRADERRVGLRRTRRPDGGLARAVIDWARGATARLGAAGDRRGPGRLRPQRPPADRPGAPTGPGGTRSRRPGKRPSWPWPSSGGAWWGPTIRHRWGPRLTRRCRRSVIRACSPTPWRRSALTRRTSSAATSPTSTCLCSPWSTCPKWSKEHSSPGTRARPRACGACSSTSSWASSTSPATPRSMPRSG